MDTGNKINTKRKALGLTLDELGKKVGVGASTVRKWETGYIESMRSDKIQKLAAALETTPGYLMGWTDNSSNVKVDSVHANNGVIGQNSGTLTTNNGHSVDRQLSKEEMEILRIYNNLNVKDRMELLMTAMKLGDNNE